MAENKKHEPRYVPGAEGLVKISGKSQLPQEFITAAKNFQEALGKTTLRDHNHLSTIMLYKSQLELFDLTEEIDNVTGLLNGYNAIGGYNKALAVMAHSGIVLAEGLGIKLSKEDKKDLQELQKQRARLKQKDEEASGSETP